MIYSVKKNNKPNRIKSEALERNGFKYAPYTKKGMYDWCDNNKQSRMTVRIPQTRVYNNKMKFFQHFKGASFLPETYSIQNGTWENGVSPPKPKNSKLKYYVKNPGIEKGNGITILKHDEIEAFSKKSRNSRVAFIVQPNIENVALIEGRKFDLRCYCVVASDGNTTTYRIYRHGICRLNYFKYDKNNQDTLLTNTSKGLKEKVSYADLVRVFDESLDFYHDAFIKIVLHFNEMKQKHILDFKGTKGMLVFGVDFLFDDEGKGVILEMNHNPGLRDHPFHKELYHRIIKYNLKPLVKYGKLQKTPWFFDLQV